MRPIKFTKTEDQTIFHYKYSDLKYFITVGKQEGGAGFILTKRQGSILTYRGYGTIDNPSKKLHTISMVHFDLIDGPMPTDEQRLEEPKREKHNYSFLLLDTDTNKTPDNESSNKS